MLEIALQIFFLINPLTAIPILFLGYKKGFSVKWMAIEATFLAFSIAIAFILLGPIFFKVFGINTDSLRAAGGILIALLGLSMARGTDDEFDNDPKKVTTEDTLTSLLSTPMLTGPATLSYLALKTAEVGTVSLISNTVLAFIIVGVVFLGIVQLIPNINLKYINLTSRIFGLFLLALGIEMLAAAVKVLVL